MRLEVSDVRVERGGRRVLEAVSFVLQPGEALIVSGPNGAGKSTLLRALAGLLPLASGRVVIADAEDAPPCREVAHYIGHSEGNKASLTPAENLAFWAAMLGGAGPAKAVRLKDALAAFALNPVADLPVSVLSAGQRRRVALARLLVAPRPIWLLDEPTTALDTASQIRLLDHVNRHLGIGGIAIAATHGALDLPKAHHMALGH